MQKVLNQRVALHRRARSVAGMWAHQSLRNAAERRNTELPMGTPTVDQASSTSKLGLKRIGTCPVAEARRPPGNGGRRRREGKRDVRAKAVCASVLSG
jgi:hypothetical protein